MVKKKFIMFICAAFIGNRIACVFDERRKHKRQMEDLKAMMKMRPKQWWEELS